MKNWIIVLLVVLLAGAGGFIASQQMNQDDDGASQTQQPAGQTEQAQPVSEGEGVKSIVSYTLPDGWKEASCPNAQGTVYIIPAGSGRLDCDANPSAPVKIAVDPGSTKDCNELNNPQNVKKHVCKSQFINGKKTLKATTEYLSSSTFKKEITIDAYYFDAGKEAIKLEYAYESGNDEQRGFDELANSLRAK